MRPRGSVLVLGSKNTFFFFINDPFLALMSVVSTFCEYNGSGRVYMQPSKDVYTHSFRTLIKFPTERDT